jgi:hypothetical protein
MQLVPSSNILNNNSILATLPRVHSKVRLSHQLHNMGQDTVKLVPSLEYSLVPSLEYSLVPSQEYSLVPSPDNSKVGTSSKGMECLLSSNSNSQCPLSNLW